MIKQWLNVYDVFCNDPEWKIKLENALKALKYRNVPEKISKDNIDKMYGDTLQASVSKLEQYSKCPFSYFLKYGLKLDDRESVKVESVDTGSFMHDVIDSFFSNMEEEGLTAKTIEDDKITEIVNRLIEEKLKLDRNYIFTTSAKYVNLINRLKRVVIISIKYIVQTLKQSDFEVFGHEIEFDLNGKYKPIKICTDSGKTVEIVGKIDRVDIAKNPEGTYVRIIDYKSSIRDIDLNQVVAGMQLQLLTYLNETCKVEDFLPAGVLYFELEEPKIPKRVMSDDEIKEEIKQQFKMQGMILADINIVKMMDNKLEEGANSEIIGAGIKKGGELTKNTKGINSEQFKNLQKYTDKILKKISEEILSGKIDLNPAYNLKLSRGKTPCEYCKYKSICRFDVNNEGNSYNYIGTLNKDAALEIIKEC